MVQLTWETSREENNDYFTVERTANGIAWEIIEIVDGAGSSSKGLQYQSLDREPMQPGKTYYRLKQTDFDGRISYSNTTTVNMGDSFQEKASIFPNPAREVLTLSANQSDLTQFKIFNLQGTEVTRYTTTVDLNDKSVRINISNLSSGMYILWTPTKYFKFSKQTE